MGYVDALHDRKADVIRVAERVNGKRVLVEHKPEYNFYVADPRGKFRSTFGETASEIKCRNGTEFKKNVAMNRHNQLFESDIKPLNKTIAKHYLGVEPPKLHTCFFDIEVDFDPERGYASPEEAFMPITAIGVYLQWAQVMICLAVPPPTITFEQAQSMANRLNKDNTQVVLFDNEKEMLHTFLDLIDDADILSGWNSEGYDIPYTINRIKQTIGKQELRRLCLWDQLPKSRTYEMYGKEQQTFDLFGRVHMDYLQLYRNYSYEERHSYKLDFIGEMEVGEKKVEYEGTLDQLYKNDFERFMEYNIQDTLLLDKLDQKLQYIDLANSIAHDNTVLLPTTMGAVATTEQAIINEAHRRGYIVPDRKRDTKDSAAAGAWVAVPKKGLHEWIGSMDINSLYPSVFRALNMGPETIVGQIRLDYTQQDIKAKMDGTWIKPDGTKLRKGMTAPECWVNKFATNEYEFMINKDTRTPLHLELEGGETLEMYGNQLYDLVFNSDNPWNISANGTIFKNDFQGIIPGLLERWYAERKELQAKKGAAENKEEKAFWDKRQLVKKINLNSLYGAILNEGCRFFDKRIGQSTTLTGRMITRHMAAETNRVLTGNYDYEGKCIIYGDTDSTYFSAVPILKDNEELDQDSATGMYDQISDMVSDTFPAMMRKSFNVPLKDGQVIKAGREVVGRFGLFITKKRYAINCVDIEGDVYPDGKLKIMGMDIKRSDTPEFIQDFLEGVLKGALSGKPEDEVIEEIKTFKKEFAQLDPWLKGMPKRVNKLTSYTEKYEKLKGMSKTDPLNVKKKRVSEEKINNMIPGHVTASIHWNYLKQMNHDNYSMKVVDGMKVIVCRLKQNPMGYTSVAYPVDEPHLPDWFKALPFDEEMMTASVLTKKTHNVLGAMGWDLTKADDADSFTDFFEYG